MSRPRLEPVLARPVGQLGPLQPDDADGGVAGGAAGAVLAPEPPALAAQQGAVALHLEHLPLQPVVGPHELGGEEGGGLLVDAGGRGVLLDAPLVEEQDAVGHRQGLGLVVGHHHRADAEPLDQLAQPEPGLLAQLGVEVGERLVEQEQARVVDQGPGQGHALLLAAGELVRVARRQRLQADLGQDVVHLLGDDVLGDPPQLQPVGHVVLDGLVRPERVGLEDQAEVALLGRDHLADGRVEEDLVVERDAALVGVIEAGDGPQQGGLPRAGGAEQRHHLAARDVEGDAPQDLVLAQLLVDVGEDEPRHGA